MPAACAGGRRRQLEDEPTVGRRALALADAIRGAVPIIDGRRRGRLPAVRLPAIVVRGVLRGSAIAVGAQTMHWEERGAFTGEISPAMLRRASAATYVILGHSERRQYDGETDEAVGRKVASAVAHGLRPIAAVGERADERRGGRDRDGGRPPGARRRRRASSGCAGTGLVIAYEPVWAIGTGDAASAPTRRRWRRQIRAILRELDPDGADEVADPVRRQRHRRQRGRVLRPAGHRRRAGRRRSLDARSSSREIVRAAGSASRARDRRCLVVLDGFGMNDDPAPQRAASRRRCGTGTASSRSGRTPARRVGRGRRPARRPDGQQRGRPPQPRRRLPGRSRTCRASTRPSRTARSSTNADAASQLSRRARSRGGRLHLLGLVGPGGVHARRRAPRRAWSSWRTASGSRRTASVPRLHRRARHAAALGRCVPAAPSRLASRGRAHGSPRSAAATTPWTATNAGIGRSCAYDAIVHGAGRRAPRRRRRRSRQAYARGESDEFIQPHASSTAPAPRSADGDAVVHLQLPRRPRPPADPGARACRLRRLRPRRAAAGLGHHAHRVPGARRAAGARSPSRRS